MKHALGTNRKDRAQRAARYQKFNESRSEVTKSKADPLRMDFSNLTEEEIFEERNRIELLKTKRKKSNRLIIS